MATYVPGTIFSAFILENRGSELNLYLRLFPLLPTGLAALLLYLRLVKPVVLGYATWLSLFLSASFAGAVLNDNFEYLKGSIMANIPIIITPAVLLPWHYRHTLVNLAAGIVMNVSFVMLFNRDEVSNYATYWLIMTPMVLGAAAISLFRYNYTRSMFLAGLRIRQANHELQAQRDSLIEINSMNQKFISILAHDLSNSMHHVLGSSENLLNILEDQQFDDSLEAGRMLFNSTRSTCTLLNNLLQWSLVRDGQKVFNPERHDVNQLCRTVAEQTKGAFESKQIKLQTNYENNLFSLCDSNMISVVIHNLLGNALKFTPRGSTISLSTFSRDGTAIVQISDEGIGMTIQQIDELFSPTRSFKSRGTDGERGAGVGLWLCHEFVRKNGGQISAHCEGQGCRFTFSLPLVSP